MWTWTWSLRMSSRQEPHLFYIYVEIKEKGPVRPSLGDVYKRTLGFPLSGCKAREARVQLSRQYGLSRDSGASHGRQNTIIRLVK